MNFAFFICEIICEIDSLVSPYIFFMDINHIIRIWTCFISYMKIFLILSRLHMIGFNYAMKNWFNYILDSYKLFFFTISIKDLGKSE